ncbi:MAG: NAD(P)/FAD-dependent oxidoreductase [Haloglomus sp.]
MHVVVVGGGIVGLASAHALAERGVDVTVCEQGAIGSGATERSAGGIRTQFSTAVNVRLSLASIEVWEDFEAQFGVGIDYRRTGYLFLARETDTADAFAEDVAMQNDLSVPSELLSPAEAAEHCPGLHADRFEAATYCPLDGFADPHLALQGFARAAREAGVDIRTHTPVTEIHHQRGGRESDGDDPREGAPVAGVTAGGSRIEADGVVNAAGPWARRVNEMAGVDLPVAPRRRQIAVVEPSTALPEDVPLTIDLDTGSYFRPEREGTALVGGHFADDDPDADPDTYDEGMDLSWAATAVERAGACADYFGPETRIRRGWAGLYAVTPDHHAIVDEIRPGFVTAVGFSGHGFQHAPATGQLVADLVCDGDPSLVEASALAADRFERGAARDERNVA